jgi:hypothetical protein
MNTVLVAGVLALTLTSSVPVTMNRLTSDDAGSTGQAATERSNARIRGRVFAADTGKPLAGAIVALVNTRASNPTERQGKWIRTDADGRWEAPTTCRRTR